MTATPRWRRTKQREHFSTRARGKIGTKRQNFVPWLSDSVKQLLGRCEIVTLGNAFTSDANAAMRFVPYEIRLKSGATKKHNVALRNDNPTHRWVIDGGI